MRTPAGLELGRDIIKLVKTFVLAGANQATEIQLDTLPSMEAGMELVVRGLILVLPQCTVSVAAGKVWDMISLSQAVAQITVALSDGAPPSKYNRGHLLIDSVDGYRALMGLQYLSNKPVFATRNSWSKVLAAGATDQGSSAVGAFTWQQEMGWPQYCGPFATAAGGGAYAANPSIVMYLPVGERVGEAPGDCAIPARWFNGQPAGKCQSAAPGFIRLTQGSTIDGNAITWTAGSQVTVYAVCRVVPRERMPIPVVPFVRTKSFANNRWYADPGTNGLLAFCKPLSAGGQQTHGTTQANLWDNQGNNLVYGQSLQANTTGLNRLVNRAEIYQVDDDETALSHANTARYTRCLIPLVLCDGQLTDCIGDVNRGPEVEVVASTDTTYDFLQAGWQVITPEVRRCAELWAGADMSVAETANGNTIGPTGLALGVDQLLPQSIAMKIQPGSVRNC